MCIAQVEPPLQQHSPAQTSGRKSHQSAKDSTGGDVINRHVYIHPQAAPVVCRHVIDALIFLSRMYPGYFVASHTAKHAHTVKTQGKSSVYCEYFMIQTVALSLYNKRLPVL